MTNTDMIRELNDRFRTTFRGGQVLMTRGVAARDDADQVLNLVKAFNTFSEDDDPHGEHDFGAIDHDGEKIFWKIDYYDSDLQQGSQDPAEPAVTTRVLTIMLADEY